MPKLREYVQEPRHDTSISSVRSVDPVPTTGYEYSGGQPVKLKFDATSGQQTIQVRSLMWDKTNFNDQKHFVQHDTDIILAKNAGRANKSNSR